MTPPKPANDERPRLFPRMSLRAEERIWLAISLTVLVGGFLGAVAILDARHWLTIAVIVGVGFVLMLVGGLWRALIGGRP